MIVTPKDSSPKYDRARCDWIRGYFKGHDVYIVAGGPSLLGFDFARLKRRRVVAINHSYRYCDCEVLVFLDSKFLSETRKLGHDLYSMPFKIIAGPSSGMRSVGNCTTVQLSQTITTEPHSLYGRAQTGLVAINMALVGHAKTIYLLGFDGKFSSGLGHFYSKEYPHSQDGNEEQYRKMVRCYEKFKPYPNIINCNTDSAYDMFKKIDIEDIP